MIDKSFLLTSIAPLLKEKGFKKRENTWTLELSETIVVFNIQNSQYDKKTYYINIGSALKIVEEQKKPTIATCHIWQRVDIEFENAEQIMKMIDMWIERYGSNSSVHKNILSNRMPKTTKAVVYKYLSAYSDN